MVRGVVRLLGSGRKVSVTRLPHELAGEGAPFLKESMIYCTTPPTGSLT